MCLSNTKTSRIPPLVNKILQQSKKFPGNPSIQLQCNIYYWTKFTNNCITGLILHIVIIKRRSHVWIRNTNCTYIGCQTCCIMNSTSMEKPANCSMTTEVIPDDAYFRHILLCKIPIYFNQLE